MPPKILANQIQECIKKDTISLPTMVYSRNIRLVQPLNNQNSLTYHTKKNDVI